MMFFSKGHLHFNLRKQWNTNAPELHSMGERALAQLHGNTAWGKTQVLELSYMSEVLLLTFRPAKLHVTLAP